jgi:hypothetical protein
MHTLALSLVPAGPAAAEGGAPVEVAVLDAGTYRVLVGDADAAEERALLAAGGEAVYDAGDVEMALGPDEVAATGRGGEEGKGQHGPSLGRAAA